MIIKKTFLALISVLLAATLFLTACGGNNRPNESENISVESSGVTEESSDSGSGESNGQNDESSDEQGSWTIVVPPMP